MMCSPVYGCKRFLQSTETRWRFSAEFLRRLPQTYQRFPAQLQEWPQALINVRVGCHELLEVTLVVQLPLVIAHASFHQQAGDAILHTTWLRKQRAPEDLIRYWLGHAKESVTDGYSKLAEDLEFRLAHGERLHYS